jgi:hypothetical protein
MITTDQHRDRSELVVITVHLRVSAERLLARTARAW